MTKRIISVLYHFLLEFTLLLLCNFFFYIESRQLPPILTLLGLSFTGILLLLLLVEKFSNKGKWLFLLIVLPLLLIAGTKLHFSIYSVGLLGLLIFWRGLSLYRDYTGNSETLYLFLTFFIGIMVIIYSAMSHYPYQFLIVLLLIYQIILVLLGLFISKWSNITEDKTKFIIYFFKVLAGAAMVGGIVTFILKYIQTIFFGIFSGIALTFSYLAIPVFKLWQWIISLFFQGERKPQLLESDVGKVDTYRGEPFNLPLNVVIFMIILIGAAILVYYVRKKRVETLYSSAYSTSVIYSEANIVKGKRFFSKKRTKPPQDPIRREIYLLEKYAYNLKLGRFRYETLDEWWGRIGLIKTEAANIIYDKIRYGMVVSTVEEQAEVKQVMSDLKLQLKNLAKSAKEAENN
jgi:hypothetical protein